MINKVLEYIAPTEKLKEFCPGFGDFIKIREKAFERTNCYSASWNAGVRDAYCGFVCPYRPKNFISLKELTNGKEDPDELASAETSALLSEIDLDKYYLSMKANHDVGERVAVEDFMENHFSVWMKGFRDCVIASSNQNLSTN